MKKRIIFVAFAMMLACSCVFAGPFGIEMGWTKDEMVDSGVRIIDSLDTASGVFCLVEPTSKHSSFEKYYVWIDDVYGIYGISAESDSIRTSSRGTELRSAFFKVNDQVSTAYGEPLLIDNLAEDSIWDQPGDYMYALVDGDRSLMALWGESDDIAMIVLSAEAESLASGSISLLYYGSDYIQAMERESTAEASVF